MKKTGACPKCSSRNIMENVVIADKTSFIGTVAQELEVRVFDEKKGNNIFSTPKYQKANIRGWVCGDCGFLELYIGTD
jgi:predicted nucleic-acid-binding Zn-ribbon protein